MSQQGGALAGLRRAIVEFSNALVDRMAASARRSPMHPHRKRTDAAKAHLDAELTAVEARLSRLARFVRAWDAHETACLNWQASSTWPPATMDELHAARAALTAEDTAP